MFSRSSRISLMPRFDAASISITSTDDPEAISTQLEQTPQGVGVGPFSQFRQRGQNARDGSLLAGAALARKNIAMRDPVLRDRVLNGGFDVFLADELAERLRPVLAGDYLIHGGKGDAYARPRVIRGTRVKPLPLLPSDLRRGLQPPIARSREPDNFLC